MMHKVLIANRGEIACRMIEAAQSLGIETVAVYSDADRYARHVRLADEAFWIGPSDVHASYLNQARLIAIAKKAQCDAVHPGYGLLSEKADFAKACEVAGLLFIGPKSETIAKLGDKAQAKALAQSLQIPVSESLSVPDHITDAWCEAIQAQGHTWLIKACCGGGGRGMRRVTPDDDLAAMIIAARREAINFFDDGSLLLERLIEPARHIEVQIIADKHGHVYHLFDRDCSVQRRYQKVIEEAPALGIAPHVRQAMLDAAVKLAKAVNYENVGTVEFLLDANQHFYFLEMNTRIQVEHPVTELVCQQDLVQWQFRIAEGAVLNHTPVSETKGVAIEVRLCAEQPDKNFLPSIGRIQHIAWPNMPHVRIDTGFERGDRISSYYDSLLAKMVVWGDDRAQAILRLQQALNQTRIIGIDTNRHWLMQIACDPVFQAGTITTDYLKTHPKKAASIDPALVCAFAAVHACLQKASSKKGLHQQRGYWRQCHQPILLKRWLDGQGYRLSMRSQAQDSFIVTCENATFNLSHCVADAQALTCIMNQETYHVFLQKHQRSVDVFIRSHIDTVYASKPKALASHSLHDQAIRAPLPGEVVKVLVQAGDQVKAGQAIMMMEAMKMEHPIKAVFDGQVVSISAQMNDRVALNTVLAVIQPSSA